MRGKLLNSILIGAAVGLLAGLTGVGGGVFLVPLLVGVLAISQYEAHGTSLLVIFPVALVGAITYTVLGHMDWAIFLLLAFGGVFGVVLGAKIMTRVSERKLRWLFCILLVSVGFCMVFSNNG